MKKLLKKLAAIVTIAAVTLTMAVAIPTPASADSIYDTAKAISSGESVSTYIWRYDEADYKITSTENGTLKLSLDAQMPSVTIYVFDTNGNYVEISDSSSTSGSITKPGDDIGTAKWNNTIERFKGTISYTIEKGTYYIRFSRKDLTGDTCKLTFTTTYPSSTSTAKINYITINLPKGSTLSLGADTTGSGTVTWKSSKSKVATVSSTGTVTAKAKGSAIITAKSGKSSKKIKIVVS